MFGFFKRRRRRRIAKVPLAANRSECLARNVPYARWLPDRERSELERHTKVLLHEKNFEGCGGLELTDEMRVTIAGHAAVLLLNREHDYYPRLYSILVYPEEFISTHGGYYDDDGILTETDRVLIGESSELGAVALAWSQIRYDMRHPDDGVNVIYHELAHQLDAEDRVTDGAPLLESREDYAEWIEVFTTEYEELQQGLHRNRRGVIDAYGATHPAEFFAVVTESFFERPHALRRRHPLLYDVLKDYYRQDPAEWMQN